MSAALKLELFQNGELLREIPLDSTELWVGRDEDCVVRLEDRAISRKHALLRSSEKGGLEFEKKSKFGQIKLNGKEVDQMSLKGGDRLEMGPFEIRVQQKQVDNVIAMPVQVTLPVREEVKKPEIELPTTEIEAAAPVEEAAPVEVNFSAPEGVEAISFDQSASQPDSSNEEASGGFDFAKVDNDGATRVFVSPQKDMKAVLQFGEGTANVTHYEITDDEIAIGRSQKCHVVLEDKRSSRKHSLILRRDQKYYLKDLGSSNGTLVNGERVDEQELQSGDVIQIGDTHFSFKMLQADYEQKKEGFIQVPHEAPPVVFDTPMPQMAEPEHHLGFDAPVFDAPPAQDYAAPEPMQEFTAPPAEKKSFIGNFLDNYRAMNTKKQIIYGAAILAGVYFMLDDDPEQKKAHLNTGQVQKAVVKKVDKKPGNGQSFEALTPEQQHYVETEYQLAFDFYKNREYDNSLLEISKIHSLVQDYKNAHEIETYAREGKRKLEAQEEERKKKEQERQAQIKLQGLLDRASGLMAKKRYNEAEVLFPEIELLQPENSAVSEWRKQMVNEKERIDREQAEKKRVADLIKEAWTDFDKTVAMAKEKKYWEALDAFDLLAERVIPDKKFQPAIQEQIKKIEDTIKAERDPFLVQGKQLEGEGKLFESYKAYQKAQQIDPTNSDAPAGMARIRGTLNSKAKSIYAEGVFAESYTDLDTAEKRYREVLDVVPDDDEYYLKANARLKKLTVLRKPASEGVQ